MFQELNMQYSFTDEYMKCPQNYMHLLNPFGDVPKKLIIEFQRSFNAAKVLSQSIKSASGIIKSVKEVSLSLSLSLSRNSYEDYYHINL